MNGPITYASFSGDYNTEVNDDYVLKTASFTDLVPGQQYVLLSMASLDVDNLISPENLLYIKQGTATADGTLAFEYVQRIDTAVSYVILCGASEQNLYDAEITFPEISADGKLHVVEPDVVYDGTMLVEGKDYIITGTVDYTLAGEYTCYIRGINAYSGVVECRYVVNGHEHEYTAVTITPTCTEQGHTTYTCECGDIYIGDYVEALGHTEVIDYEIFNGCTENGLTEGSHCSTCGEVFKAQEIIYATGHEYGDWFEEVAPTCGTLGEECRYCDNCDHFETREVAALGHDGVQHDAKAPTCTAIGWDDYVTCSRCDYTTYVELPASGHTYGEWLETTAPKCTEVGEERRECDNCDHYETREVKALGHDKVYYEAKDPTCLEDGYKAYETCSRCDYTTYERLPATGHSVFYHEGKSPTCTEIGWNAYETCGKCDYSTYVELPAKGHSHTATVTPPTCTEQGYTTYTCHCGDSYVSDYVDVNGHSFGEWSQTVAPTCTTKGEDRRDCDNCVHYETREVATLGHDKVHHDAKAPTCTEVGWNAYETCGKCDYSTYVELPSKGHTVVTDTAVPATCTSAGLTEGKHCSACDKILTEQQTTDALGHDFADEWTVDVEPTTTATGLKTRHCSRCDETCDPIEIPKLVEIVDASKLFRDLKVKKWSIDGINYVVSYGYMNGTGDGTTFDQTGSMTRAMIVSVLYRMAGQPETSVDNPFTDVSAKSKWYYNAVLWAYENGIVTGTSKTTFSPNGDVTREQIATFLYRYAKYKGYDTAATTDISVYPDSRKVGKWAKEALVWANAEELITGAKNGDTVLLDPQGKATREQVATILKRFCQAFAE